MSVCRKPYPSDINDEEWSLIVPYLLLQREDAGKPFEYFEQPLAAHHFTRSEDRLTFLQRMKAFLDRHNPA